MSWVQWRGEVWPATETEATLHLHLWPPDSACPRQSWSCHIRHYPKEAIEHEEQKIPRWVSVNVMDLNLQLEHWHGIAEREIRADAGWHTLHETTDEHGRLDVSEVIVLVAEMDPARRAPEEKAHQYWVGHDFIVRLGARDGLVVPVELDAWMIPKCNYYRVEPETEEEIARFAEGPPNLRVMARMRFKRCSVVVERCEDPVPRAREYLRRAIELDLPASAPAKVEWNSYRKLPNGKSEPRPGWSSVVRFDLPETLQ